MIAAIILAAGEAKRFGQTKQLVPLDGKPMLQQTIDRIAQSKVDAVVIVLGANAAEIQKHVRGRAIVNPDYAKGMSTSLHAGLRALPAKTEAVIIALGDQPFVESKTITALVDEYRRSGAKIIVPTFNGQRGNPVLVDASLFPRLMQIGGDVGCRAIFGELSVSELPVTDAGIAQDIDTMEDFECRTRHSS